MRPGENPFRSERVDALDYFAQEQPVEQIAAAFASLGYRAALVGPHGHGKTTLMHHLSRIDPPAGETTHPVIQIAADRSNLIDLKGFLRSAEGVPMIDGYDLLPWRWRRRVRRLPRVLVTSHRQTRLPTLRRCETSPAVLGELVERLSPAARRALSEEELVALHGRHRGNLRDALRALYDRVADGALRVD